jgi:hypothetical protein
VVDATRLVPDGQRIRVHGTEGYVEILTEATREQAAREAEGVRRSRSAATA